MHSAPFAPPPIAETLAGFPYLPKVPHFPAFTAAAVKTKQTLQEETMLPISFLLIFPCCVFCDQVVIETPIGSIRGFETWSFGNRLFYSFLGIPYAKPPIGPKRFNFSEPIEPWNGVFEADKHLPCLQFEPSTQYVRGTEDCLVVSVYTPKLPSKTLKPKLPVMAWIHGSEFQKGSGNADMQGPNRIMDYNVIMVTLNYRLGPLGFMTLEDDYLPGNFGLWDQKLALEWIQLNIESFGGDPGQVTLAGAGAGASSALLHYISPQSKGLFRSILSISPDSLLAIMTKKHPSIYTRKLIGKLGCDPRSIDSKSVLECLASKTSETIAKKAFMFSSAEIQGPLPFHPSIDGLSTSKSFLPLSPIEALENGVFNDVPLVIGHTKDEGARLLTKIMANLTLTNYYLKHWKQVGPSLIFHRIHDEWTTNFTQVMKSLNSRYFKTDQGPSSRQDLEDHLVQMLTETIVSSSVHLFASKAGETSSNHVYQYLYNHPGSLSLAEIGDLNFWQILIKFFGRFLGVDLYPSTYKYACHGDDQLLIFNTNSLPFDGAYNENDKMVSKTLLKLWTDFVINPFNFTTNLKPSDNQRLEISSKGLALIDQDIDLFKFWNLEIWPKILVKTAGNGTFFQDSNADFAMMHKSMDNKDEL